MPRISPFAILAAFTLAATWQTAQAIDLKKLANKIKKPSKTEQTSAAAMAPALICDSSRQMGLCYAFTGQKHLDEQATGKSTGNQMACKMMKAQLQENAQCPTANAVGMCEIKKGDAEAYTVVYYKCGRMPASKAERDCSDAKSSIHRHGAGSWSKL
jgi:hypothetical protein